MHTETIHQPNHENQQRANLRAWLWLLAGIVALILLLATGALALKAGSQAGTFAGIVAGPQGAIYLRSRPAPGAGVVTILEPGDRVEVENSRDVDGSRWYQVRTERGRLGWLPEERVERTN